MDSAKRLRYLDAMGITVWRANADKASELPPVEVGQDALAAPVDPLDQALERAIQAKAPVLPELLQPPSVPAAVQPEVSEPAPLAGLGRVELEASARACRRCGLCEERQQAVFGAGAQNADLMVIGEGPGAEEDRQGLPFVGPAGQLLDAMLAAIDYSRAPKAGQQGAYIANVVKCRPPQNRDPKAEEATACQPYLERQIELLKPRLILAVGRIAAQNLLGSSDKLGQLREGMHEYRLKDSGQVFPVLVTYHPAYLLRSPHEKRKAWDDLKRARSLLAARP